jgi:integrase
VCLRLSRGAVGTTTLDVLKKAGNAAGLNPEGAEPIGQHDLRHTAAALALQSGANPAEVAELMRHSNPSVTMKAYARLTRDGRGAAYRKLLDAGFGV